jgi:hypothetical protein
MQKISKLSLVRQNLRLVKKLIRDCRDRTIPRSAILQNLFIFQFPVARFYALRINGTSLMQASFK